MNNALEFYKDEPSVASVGAYVPPVQVNYLLRFLCVVLNVGDGRLAPVMDSF